MGAKQSFSAAKPNDNRIGRLDNLGVRYYSVGEGFPPEARAIVREHKIDKAGDVHAENHAYGMTDMHRLQERLRAESKDPNNANPHIQKNLDGMKHLANALDKELESDIVHGRVLTKQSLQTVGAAEAVTEAIRYDSKPEKQFKAAAAETVKVPEPAVKTQDEYAMTMKDDAAATGMTTRIGNPGPALNP